MNNITNKQKILNKRMHAFKNEPFSFKSEYEILNRGMSIVRFKFQKSNSNNTKKTMLREMHNIQDSMNKILDINERQKKIPSYTKLLENSKKLKIDYKNYTPQNLNTNSIITNSENNKIRNNIQILDEFRKGNWSLLQNEFGVLYETINFVYNKLRFTNNQRAKAPLTKKIAELKEQMDEILRINVLYYDIKKAVRANSLKSKYNNMYNNLSENNRQNFIKLQAQSKHP